VADSFLTQRRKDAETQRDRNFGEPSRRGWLIRKTGMPETSSREHRRPSTAGVARDTTASTSARTRRRLRVSCHPRPGRGYRADRFTRPVTRAGGWGLCVFASLRLCVNGWAGGSASICVFCGTTLSGWAGIPLFVKPPKILKRRGVLCRGSTLNTARWRFRFPLSAFRFSRGSTISRSNTATSGGTPTPRPAVGVSAFRFPLSALSPCVPAVQETDRSRGR